MYTGKYNAMVNAQCPYFKSEFIKTITCDGIDDTIVMIKFPTEESKDNHVEKYCCKYENRCPLAIGLDERWRE